MSDWGGRHHDQGRQLDELWSFVHTKEAHLPGAKLYGATYGDAWVWIAFAPVWRLVLAFVIGKRDQANADLLLARVAHVTDHHIPFFTSDQLPEYKNALLTTYGEWYQPERQGTRGAYPNPRRRPLPALLYAQVVKQTPFGRTIALARRIPWSHRYILGSQSEACRPDTHHETWPRQPPHQ